MPSTIVERLKNGMEEIKKKRKKKDVGIPVQFKSSSDHHGWHRQILHIFFIKVHKYLDNHSTFVPAQIILSQLAMM